MTKRRKVTIITIVAALAAIIVAWLCCLPRELFKGCAYSSCVRDRDGGLLGARIASDGQWRFPPCDSVPDRYATAVIEFEDRRFRRHPGVDILAVGRAVRQNLSGGHTVSGASTISMQVIRMSRRGRYKSRSYGEKFLEAVMATRLEARYSKDEILALYATHAPFGGNVVGIEAAAWRYFGHSPAELSWGEAALLAVLPNSPSSIHISRNRDRLLEKRNSLLRRLCSRGVISEEECGLACSEPLPGEPEPLPEYAAQYVERLCSARPGEEIHTSISLDLQKQVEELCLRHCRDFSTTGINDLAAVVVDVRSGEVLAWVGNSDKERKRDGAMVDIAWSPRSTGSILKPLLYTAALQDGQILPNTLLKDTPLNIDGFKPQNFDRQYAGAVPASDALSRSLNVPFVVMLRNYGVARFDGLLRNCGMTSLSRSADEYGLSLILGGAEARLAEVARIYADIACWYQLDDSEIAGDKGLQERFQDFPFYDRTSFYYCLEALSRVNRPDEMDWRQIPSVRKIAWKTGTSWGFRDAWAVGISSDYVVGVWAGNALGQSAPGLLGARTAGPVMFEIFNLLPRSAPFDGPRYGEYISAEVCRESGMLKGQYCEECDTLMLPKNAMRSRVCAYHKSDGSFVLPPAMDWYWRRRNPSAAGSHESDGDAGRAATGSPAGDYRQMEFIYPENGSILTAARQIESGEGGIVFQLAHRNPDATVYWHLDSEYLGQTRQFHSMTLNPAKGQHHLTVVDRDGSTASLSFTIK